MKKIVIILTCYNRKNKTLNCIKSIFSSQFDIKYIVLDDNSKDGTKEAIAELKYDITLLQGTGELYWNGGMHKAISYIFMNKIVADYYLLVNDDIEFYDNIIEKLISESVNKNDAVIVGATCDENRKQTYGAVKYFPHGIKYRTVGIDEATLKCDTFNCNCVLVNKKIFHEIGNFDPVYKHAFGDFDYGLRIKKAGYPIYVSTVYVGICNINSISNTWMDTSLSKYKRLKLKESIKGLPRRQWFHFLKTHFGLRTALIRSITPYIKIMIKK